MSVILTDDELKALTGYKRPGDQLRELLRQGFWRARRSRVTGEVILERPHFEQVSRGASTGAETTRPQVRPVGQRVGAGDQSPKTR